MDIGRILIKNFYIKIIAINAIIGEHFELKNEKGKKHR